MPGFTSLGVIPMSAEGWKHRSPPMTQHVKDRPQSGGARREEARRRHLDKLLDQALEDTFPASDPVAVVQPAPEPHPDDAEPAPKPSRASPL